MCLCVCVSVCVCVCVCACACVRVCVRVCVRERELEKAKILIETYDLKKIIDACISVNFIFSPWFLLCIIVLYIAVVTERVGRIRRYWLCHCWHHIGCSQNVRAKAECLCAESPGSGLLSTTAIFMMWQTPLLKSPKSDCSCCSGGLPCNCILWLRMWPYRLKWVALWLGHVECDDFQSAGNKYWFSVFIRIGCFRHYSVWKRDF